MRCEIFKNFYRRAKEEMLKPDAHLSPLEKRAVERVLAKEVYDERS